MESTHKTEDGNGESREKPNGYDSISQRLGGPRERILLELNEDGILSAAHLQQEGSANIKSGSMKHHIKWLQGRDVYDRPKPWWPDEDMKLVAVVGEVPTSGSPSPQLALTKFGKRFIEYHKDEDTAAPSDTLGNIKIAARSNRDEIDRLNTVVKNQNDRITDLEQELSEKDDQIWNLEQELSSKDERIDDLEGHIETILNHLGV